MIPSKIGFITLAVADLERAVAFYQNGLGWRTNGIEGREFHDEVTGADGTIAIFQLGGGLMLGLYERKNLALDAQVLSGSPNPTEFSLGLVASSKEEVDQILSAVKAAGAKMPAPAHLRPFGVYSGYFQDPDGHLWEVAWNADV